MGSMFGGGLTKTAVSDAGGTKYYDSAPGAAQAAGSGASLYTPDLSGQQMGEDNSIPVTKGPDPTISQPTFQQAKDNFSALTTKGKILGGILQLAGGAANGAGANSFGEGFARAEQARRADREERRKSVEAEQEAQLRALNIQQAPQLFQLGVQSKRADINKDNALAGYYGDRSLSNDTVNVPGVGLVDKHTHEVLVKAPEKVFNPNSEAALSFVAAGSTPQAEQAKTALGIVEKKQKAVKGAPSGSGGGATHVRGQATVAASQFLQKHSGDAEAAIADFQAQLPAAIAKNPAVQDAAPYIIQEIKKAGKKKSNKPALQFANTGK